MTMIFHCGHEPIEIIHFREHEDFELTFVLVLLYTDTMIFYHDHDYIEIINNFEQRTFELAKILSSL